LQIHPTAEYLRYDNCKELPDFNENYDNDIYDHDDDDDVDDDNNKDNEAVDEVDRIVDQNEGNNISSISGVSETTGTTTVSVITFETLPKEFRNGVLRYTFPVDAIYSLLWYKAYCE